MTVIPVAADLLVAVDFASVARRYFPDLAVLTVVFVAADWLVAVAAAAGLCESAFAAAFRDPEQVVAGFVRRPRGPGCGG